MWMVVSEDPAGRLRYQYHNLPPPAAQSLAPPLPTIPSSNPSTVSAAQIYSPSSLSGHHSRMQGFTRGGCLSFPDPMGASPRTNISHTLPGGGHYYEMEQYDNVNDYSTYGGPDSSSSTSSSPEYQDPVYSTRYGGSTETFARRQSYSRCYVPISADAFYYYHQQKQQQHPQALAYGPRHRSSHNDPRRLRAPSPDPDYSPPLSRNKVRFHIPEEKLTNGEYVSNTQKSTVRHKVSNTDAFEDEGDYAAVSMNPDPTPHHDSVLVHRSNGKVSVMVTKIKEPIYCSGGSDSAESSSATPSSVEAETPPPIPSHPPARHRLVKKSQKELNFRNTPSSTPLSQNGIGMTPTRPLEITQAYGGTIRGPPMAIGGGQGITPMGTMAASPISHTQIDGNTNSSGSWFRKDKNKKKDKKSRIKKEDISNPTNFQHKAHVGWNQDVGFSNQVYDDDMDEATRNILKAAGLESNNLNEDDKKFVKKFIAKNYDKYVSVGNLDSSSISAPLPPQQPSVIHSSSWNQTPARPYKPSFPAIGPVGTISSSSSSYSASPAAPPPPTRVESYGLAPARPPPPPPSNSRGMAPSRPLPQAPSYGTPDSRPHAVPPPPPPLPIGGIAPISSAAPPPPPPPPPVLPSVGAGAPPPPPPPPPSGGSGSLLANLPPAQNGRSNLLAEIQAGKQLRSVQQSTDSPKSGDARGDVMAQIRQGAQLKHVDAAAEQERRKSSATGVAGMGGLAGALAKALEERRLNMGIDDSSDDEDPEDDKNEWSD